MFLVGCGGLWWFVVVCDGFFVVFKNLKFDIYCKSDVKKMGGKLLKFSFFYCR